ncbi:transport protein Sec1 [Hamiltosporidium magnivora]|uniref:Transport protein Sec1 n=1 Tax=Hamiltosporidium magnivora TaxID=148818 RepID=A0A4Q9L081_9MICR|nr:transport protein Sec1 [Hamiltosporidium magnivora]
MIRDIQKNRIKEFLQVKGLDWKVLILDKKTHEIISPLLKINELRECGVTSHFMLKSNRNRISDTPAIYFVEGNKENVEIIINDIQKGLYVGFYLNFVNSIDRRTLETLAFELSKKGVAFQVKSVFDHFIDFISLQNDLFITNLKFSFKNLQNIETWKGITNSLFGVFLCLNQKPLIIFQKKSDENFVPKNISKMLESKIKNFEKIQSSRKKPLLIIIDRYFDLISPFEHVWNYSALIKDLMEFHLNRVQIEDEKEKNINYDLDPSDFFWMKNQNEFFPLVAEKVEKELLEYKKEVATQNIKENINKMNIHTVLEKAPEMSRRNEIMHSHMKLCLKLVEKIKERNIDDFYKIEKSKYKKNELIDISEKGNEDDILRLAISLIKKEKEEILSALLKKRNINNSCFEFVKNNINLNTEDISNTGTSYTSVVSNVLGNIKKLLPLNTDMPISILVENIWNKFKNGNVDGYDFYNLDGTGLCYDKEISSIIVFCLGGGTYAELKSLKVLENKIQIPIIYGSTEMLNSKEFTEQILELNKN